MHTTQERCLFCKVELSEGVITDALLVAWWHVLGPYDDDLHNEGGAPMPSYVPRYGEHWNLQWTPELGWQHVCCPCEGAAMGLFVYKLFWQQGMIATAEYEAFRDQILPFLPPEDLNQYREGETDERDRMA